MQVYCNNCKKHVFKKKLVQISKNKTKRKLKCTISLTERIFIHKIEDECDLEIELEAYLQFFTD